MRNPTRTAPPVDFQTLVDNSQGDWFLDSTGSSAEFRVKHFWGAITVRGHFTRIEGSGTVTDDGAVSGQVRIDAASLTTKNKQRDKHLRSEDFFDVDRHPDVLVTVSRLEEDAASKTRRAHLELSAAGKSQSLQPDVEILDATQDAVTLRAEIVVDRRKYGMMWSPLKMASYNAVAEIKARFVREQQR
jgi:polyisoprenoid-binding protein YceI